jgi:hypothetical protein
MLSGPTFDEKSKKWLTINSDLAIFPITSIYDGYNHLFMKEYLSRSINPHSRCLFLNDISNRFSINAHGTFVFDEYPNSLLQIQKFYMDVFNIKNRNHGYIQKLLPQNTITFPSTDGMPIIATFKKITGSNTAAILYPPRYQSRNYYDSFIEKIASNKITVLIPNTKRTCRSEDKLFLCEREIIGAVNFLRKNYGIKKIIITFPSFYFLAAKDLAVNNVIPDADFIFVETGDHNYGINPKNITNTKNKIYYLKHMNIDALVKIMGRDL